MSIHHIPFQTYCPSFCQKFLGDPETMQDYGLRLSPTPDSEPAEREFYCKVDIQDQHLHQDLKLEKYLRYLFQSLSDMYLRSIFQYPLLLLSGRYQKDQLTLLFY